MEVAELGGFFIHVTGGSAAQCSERLRAEGDVPLDIRSGKSKSTGL